MIWDLGKALRKKEEFESARLMDFEFRQRARAARLLAKRCGLDETLLVRTIASCDETRFVADVASQSGRDPKDILAQHADCMAEARRQLIVERGDPSPVRLG